MLSAAGIGSLTAVEDDLLIQLGGGRPERAPAQLTVTGQLGYQWWQAKTEAQATTGGSSDEADYVLASGAVLGGELRWWVRPWQLEAQVTTRPHDQRQSIGGRVRAAYLGYDPDWWDLHPFIELSADRSAVEIDRRGQTQDDDWQRWRFSLGVVGSYAELAGSQFDVFVSNERFASVLGFADETGAVQYSNLDDDFATWQLGIGFSYDWAERVATNKRRYNGFFAALRGEAAFLWVDESNDIRQQARAATGRTSIDSPYYYDFAGQLSAGWLYQRRSAQGRNQGFRLRAGYQLMTRFLGIDDNNIIADTDELLLSWDRYEFAHGPFVSVSGIF